MRTGLMGPPEGIGGHVVISMTREESLKLALQKMRDAKSPREYAQAMVEHLNRFKSPALVGVPSKTYSDLDLLNAPLLKKLGD